MNMTKVTIPTAIPAMAPELSLEPWSLVFAGGGVSGGAVEFDEALDLSPKGTLITDAIDDA
jgi:hypothetical protein